MEVSDPRYPTTICSLSEDTLSALQAEFDSLNNGKLCTELNQYGYPEATSFFRSYTSLPFSKDSVFALAVETVLLNSKFTNVSDSTELINSDFFISSNVEKTKWEIRFGPQVYKGYEVAFSWINLSIFGKEPYFLHGNWFTDIYIPDTYYMKEDSIRQRLIGEGILWYDSGGQPQEYLVSDQSIDTTYHKAVYPMDNENSLELRVAWKIPIKFIFPDVPDPDPMIGWHIYLDVMTGEILYIEQEFRT